MNFREFCAAYQLGSLERDAAWRAYDIPAVVRVRHVRYALKEMGLGYAGELGVAEVMARYGTRDVIEAAAILGAWWVWSRINAGHRVQGLAKRQERGRVLPP